MATEILERYLSMSKNNDGLLYCIAIVLYCNVQIMDEIIIEIDIEIKPQRVLLSMTEADKLPKRSHVIRPEEMIVYVTI